MCTVFPFKACICIHANQKPKTDQEQVKCEEEEDGTEKNNRRQIILY